MYSLYRRDKVITGAVFEGRTFPEAPNRSPQCRPSGPHTAPGAPEPAAPLWSSPARPQYGVWVGEMGPAREVPIGFGLLDQGAPGALAALLVSTQGLELHPMSRPLRIEFPGALDLVTSMVSHPVAESTAQSIGPSVCGALQGDPGRCRRLSPGAESLHRAESRTGRNRGIPGAVAMEQLPGDGR